MFILFVTAKNMSAQEKDTIVVIETDYGNIKLKLYNDTPLHRDNFLKLIGEDFYKDLLFHRVIKDFMIQGGDPSSRQAADSAALGSGDLGYTIDAEIKTPKYFHKRGALAAARLGNEVNPQKASSASQFYIVTGKKLSENALKALEKQRIERKKQAIFNELQVINRPLIKDLYSSGDKESLAELRNNMQLEADEEVKEIQSELLFTQEQKDAYTQIGGTPFLDDEYTVFGEVIEGMDVIDKIEAVTTNIQDRPDNNIRMNIRVESK